MALSISIEAANWLQAQSTREEWIQLFLDDEIGKFLHYSKEKAALSFFITIQ